MEILDQNHSQTPLQTETPVTVGQWMLTMLIMIVPIANIVMLCVWAFGGNTQRSRANWAKATLIWMTISFAFAIIIIGLFAGAFFAGSLFR